MASADLRAELECSLCLNIYTDPVTLKCGHNFCRVCIDRVLDTQGGSGGYSCPECREKFQDRSALQNNRKLRNISENFLSAQTSQDQSGVFCTYCVDFPVPAVRSCLLCEVSLCDKHLRVHKKSPEHILTDPTSSLESRKCSVHKKILEYYCTKDHTCVCVSCFVIGGHKGHEMESLDEASGKKKETLRNVLQNLVTTREKTEERVRSLQEHRRKVEEEAAGDTERVTALFIDLRRRLEVLEKRVLREISGRAERDSMSIEKMIRDLEIKKDELSRKMRHIEELCNMTDPLTVLQESDTGDLCDTEDGDDEESDTRDLCDTEDGDDEESDTRDLCDTEDGDDEDRERHDKLLHDGGGLDVAGILHTGLSDIITEVNVYFYIQEAADILLDVNTAHNDLYISDDRKTVSWSDIKQNRPETPERFQDYYPQVLSSRSFSSGRHYWEVDVGVSDSWRVGMCYPSIDRGGDESLIGDNKKSWGLDRTDDEYNVIHDSNEIPLSANISSNRVRIYLDYDAGRISFYDLCDPIRHLHTFTTTFTEPLHAGICVEGDCIEICGGNREILNLGLTLYMKAALLLVSFTLLYSLQYLHRCSKAPAYDLCLLLLTSKKVPPLTTHPFQTQNQSDLINLTGPRMETNLLKALMKQEESIDSITSMCTARMLKQVNSTAQRLLLTTPPRVLRSLTLDALMKYGGYASFHPDYPETSSPHCSFCEVPALVLDLLMVMSDYQSSNVVSAWNDERISLFANHIRLCDATTNSNFSQSINGNCGGRAIPKNVNLHSIVDDFIADVIVAIPSEPEEVSVIFTNNEAMKHLLNVGHDGNWFLSKADYLNNCSGSRLNIGPLYRYWPPTVFAAWILEASASARALMSCWLRVEDVDLEDLEDRVERLEVAMASADLRAELECSVCLNIYTDPVTLKCGHNFCRVCIDRVLDTQGGSGGYSCPECREEFQDRSALHKNRKLHNISENFLSAQTSQDQSGVFCTHCVDFPVPAVRSCLLCEVSLCDKHLRVHKKSPEHILTDPTSSLESRKCSVHKEVLKYFCTEDDTCVCVSCCLIGGHKGHEMESLDEASGKKKETLRNVLQKLLTTSEETEERVRSLQEHKRKVEEEAAGDTERVTALFIDLRRRLEVLEKRVLREISGRAERDSMSIEEKIRDLEIKKEELSRKMRHIEELCNMMDPLTVLQESDTGDLCDTEDGDDEESDTGDLCNTEDGDDEESDTGDLCDTEDGDDEDRERHDKLLHDGGGLDVAGILHTGLSDIITEVNVYFYIQEAADILLDVNTAQNNLHISEDRKTVSRSHIKQNRPETPERFQGYPQVLSSRRFSSGRHYWEVDVGRSGSWRVGMCYPSIDRRGKQSLIGGNKKSWGLYREYDEYYVIHEGKVISLSANISSNRVRIYLDYDAGRISFYDLCDPIRHLHTFTTTFTEPLHAGIGLWRGCMKICGGNRGM
ncbi:uncharacterized protein ACMZJ9_004929 [Mantella aurantiaca]